MINRQKYFYLEKSPIYNGKYLLRLDYDLFLFPNGTKGSYNVFPARLLNLSYAQYLRYCRDRLGAELIGKNSKYIIPYFESDKNLTSFLRLLNSRMAYIMHEQDYPYEYKEDENGNVVRIPFDNNEDNARNAGEV